MRLLLFNLATDPEDPILGFTTGWIRALAERVDFVNVITMRAGQVCLPENVRIYSVGKEKGYSEPRRVIEFYRHLLRVLREDDIDACFSHMIPIFSVLAAPVLKLKRIPIVTWFAHPSVTRILKLAHQLSNRMVTGIEASYRYKHDKLRVIGHGVDTDFFSPNGRRFSAELPTILCFGRLSPVKDHPTLLKAASILRQRGVEPFRVVIIGEAAVPRDKAYVSFVHKTVNELNLEGMVHFEPPVPLELMPVWYRTASVYVNLTPAGFVDKVALQAMSCGTPCVVANVGFRETLGIHSDLLIFNHGDAESLADRLIKVLALPQKDRGEIGSYLRDQVVRLHSLSGLTDRLVEILQAEAAA